LIQKKQGFADWRRATLPNQKSYFPARSRSLATELG